MHSFVWRENSKFRHCRPCGPWKKYAGRPNIRVSWYFRFGTWESNFGYSSGLLYFFTWFLKGSDLNAKFCATLRLNMIVFCGYKIKQKFVLKAIKTCVIIKIKILSISFKSLAKTSFLFFKLFASTKVFQVERERGITVKAQTCTMIYKVSCWFFSILKDDS